MQYYYTPNLDQYVNLIIKFRLHIISFYMLFVLIMATIFTPNFLSSDALFWLKDSKQLEQTQSKSFETHHLSKLVVHVENFDEKERQSLKQLHDELSGLEGVQKVYSIFSNDFVETKKSNEDSEMLTVINAGDIDALTLRKMLNDLRNSYGNVVDDDFKTFYFFISGEKFVDISTMKILGTYRYEISDGEIDWYSLGTIILTILLITFFIFRLLFKSNATFFSALLIILLSTVFTFTIIVMITGIETIHISMLFIAISIALVDFLFFYYRWHVSQYKVHRHNALVKMLSRSMQPALWTSVLTILGLGSLVFIDSEILRLLSLSLILSSVIGYILNLTFLPAFLSYFKIERARVPYAKIGYMLTLKELQYNKTFLFGFLAVTSMLMVTGSYLMYSESNTFFKLNVQNEQIELKIPYNEIDLPFIRTIDAFTLALQERFEDEIDDVVSLSTIINNLNDSNTQTTILDQQALRQALFYMDLYDLNDKYFDESAINIVINISDINKVELIQWLQNYEGIELYFIDHATLIWSAKYNQSVLLATSLSFALMIIGLITGWIFRSKAMILVGFTINAIPLVWFGMFVNLATIPLSLEMLIAMTITVGLASDATIHFAFKYFRFRYFGRSRKHALEKMYFYSGIPVIIGAVILISVFLMLYFTKIPSLELIGLYSASLILISLLTDLFILPVMLLFVDRFSKQPEHLAKP
jgi:predicted RND superfamily exporter protein